MSDSSFRAVNSGRPEKLNGGYSGQNNRLYSGATASPTTHAELLSCFNNSRQKLSESGDIANIAPTRQSTSNSKVKTKSLNESIDYAGILLNSASPMAAPSTPSASQPENHHPKSSQTEKHDDSGPFKAEMLSRMENMSRGERVMPPCDRCRRLRMDCYKNLTACLGCTKKHAKCSWKEVTDNELAQHPFNRPRKKAAGDLSEPIPPAGAAGEEDPSQPVRDEELLGEDDSDEDSIPSPAPPRIDTSKEGPGNDASLSSAPSTPIEDLIVNRKDSEHSSEDLSAAASGKANDTPQASKTNSDVDAATTSFSEAKAQVKTEQSPLKPLENNIADRTSQASEQSVNGFRSVNKPASTQASETYAMAIDSDQTPNGAADKPSVAA